MACKDEEVQKSNKSSGKYKGPEDECRRGAGGTEREGVCVRRKRECNMETRPWEVLRNLFLE